MCPSKELKIAYDCNKQESDKSSLLGTIITLWQSIEPFLTLEDTIASSKTCKTLHDTIIDTHTRKVKVSHFEFISKRETAVNFLPWALNSIHFPSLRAIQYPPSIAKASNGSVSHVTDDDIAEMIDVCFPTFCTYISQAHNLERLDIYLNTMMQCLYDNQSLKTIIGIFGQNLRFCKKLKGLTVSNMGLVTNDEDEVPGIFYSIELLKALTPVISKRKNNLEVLKVSINGSAPMERDEELEIDVQVAQDSASHDFFNAILSTTNVFDLELDIDYSSRCALALMKVAEERIRNGTVYQSNQLQRLKLILEYGNDELDCDYDPNEATKVPLVLSFSECYSLQNIELYIPERFWLEKDSLSTFAMFLKNKACLKALICHFDEMDDKDGKVFQVLVDFAMECKSNPSALKTLVLKYIRSVEYSQFITFQEVLNSIGMMTRNNAAVSLSLPLSTVDDDDELDLIDSRKLVDDGVINICSSTFKDAWW